MDGVEKLRYSTPDGFELAGILTRPLSNARGWVVMAHGILESKDEYLGFYADIASALREKGIGSLRFDFRGHGESTGTSMDISIGGDLVDLTTSIQQLASLEPHRLALVGTSFGAGPVTLYAANAVQGVEAVVLIAPVLDYVKTFLEPRTPWASASFTREALASLDTRGYLVLDGDAKLSPLLIGEFRQVKPWEALSRVRAPCLIIHGDRDSMVPFEVSRDLAGGNPTVKLVTLKGADHGFTDADDDTDRSPLSLANRRTLVETSTEFIAEHMR